MAIFLYREERNTYLTTCPLQSAKAGSAAALPQQEKNNSADVQMDGFIPRGDVSSASSSC
jgi:hypothetical protein